MVVSEAACEFTELVKSTTGYDAVWSHRVSCPTLSRGIENELGVQCDGNKERCEGFLNGKVVAAVNTSLKEEKWRLAFACRNLNCRFAF